MKKVLHIIGNKYLLTAIGFIAWTVFFDQNDWIAMKQRQKELNSVKDNITYLNTEIAKMNAERNDLVVNPQRLEQYAREHFRMKHEGEDVYVIDNSTTTK